MNAPHDRVKLGLFAAVLGSALLLEARPAPAAQTAAATVISNTASASYSDGTNTYNTNSNTVATVVQNAPSLLAGAGSAKTVAPNQLITDTFTLQNTGNNTGKITLASLGISGTDAGAALTGVYFLTVPASSGGSGSPVQYSTLAALQTAVNAVNVIQSDTLTITEQYNSGNGTAGQTVIAAVNATIAYVAGTGTSAATSTAATASETDTAQNDARLDTQIVATPASGAPATGSAAISYTVYAANGGNFATNTIDFSGALTGMPASAGVFLIDPIPAFGGTPLAISGTPSTSSSVGTATIYYTTDTTGKTGWTTTKPASAAFIGVLVTGANLPGNNGTTSNGSVTSGQAQITLTFAIVQPAGAGSGNAGSVKNVADTINGDNAATEHIVGPAGNTVATTGGAAAISAIQSDVANINPAGAGGSTNYSNQTSNSAFISASALNGPFGNATATGAFDNAQTALTSGTADTSRDFTVTGFASATATANGSSATLTVPAGSAIASAAAFSVPHTLKNTGNSADTYTLSNSTNAGWTVSYVTYSAGCTTTAIAGGVTPSVASNATYDYCVKYSPPASTPAFANTNFTITAQSNTTGGGSNATTDVLYAGGALVMFKSVAISGCPGGVTPPNSGVIPGCTMTYTVNFKNYAPDATAGSAAGSIGFVPQTFVITENGTSGGNTWGTYSGGLTAPATINVLTGAFTNSTTGNIAGSTSFTVTIPSLPAQASGTVVFSVVVT